MLKLVEDSDDEVESEISEDITNFEPSTGYKCKSQDDKAKVLFQYILMFF